jgi:hypothetical protein
MYIVYGRKYPVLAVRNQQNSNSSSICFFATRGQNFYADMKTRFRYFVAGLPAAGYKSYEQ